MGRRRGGQASPPSGAGAEDEPNQKYRDAHVVVRRRQQGSNFTALFQAADSGRRVVVADELEVVPRGVMAAGAIHGRRPRRVSTCPNDDRPG